MGDDLLRSVSARGDIEQVQLILFEGVLRRLVSYLVVIQPDSSERVLQPKGELPQFFVNELVGIHQRSQQENLAQEEGVRHQQLFVYVAEAFDLAGVGLLHSQPAQERGILVGVEEKADAL